MLRPVALALVLAACRSRAVATPALDAAGAPVAPVVAAADAGEPALSPLAPDGGWFQSFADDAGATTYVAVPTGATTRRPIVVGLHGAQDWPDWACSEWFGALGGRAFVVCPHGSRTGPDAWAWSSVDQIAKVSADALALARAHFGAWIADGPALYGGWSQAATLGAFVLAKPDAAPLFDAGVFVELGHTPLDPRAVAAAVRASRARAIAVVCATSSCEAWCARAKPAMTGFAFECESAGHRGHTFDGVVAERVWDAARFVESGDPRWEPLFSP